MATFRKTLNSNDVELPHGATILSMEPLSEDLYDKDETGPMYKVLVEGHTCQTSVDGTYHLFSDEIAE